MSPSPKSRPKPKPNGGAAWQFEAIGTYWEIDIGQPVDAKALAGLKREVNELIEGFDQSYSRFRPDSLVTRMSLASGRYELPPDARPLMKLYRELYEITDGALTPLVGQLLSDAGYDAGYSLTPGRLGEIPAWDEVMHYHHPFLTLARPVLLDFGAAGKGYLVDLVAAHLGRRGITQYCVDAGGDMIHRGDTPLKVGLEHPLDLTKVIGVAEISGVSLCGSAGNRRAWAGFSHIMDPRTRTSPSHVKAVWVVAASTLLADALTTALYFVPPATLQERYNFEYAIISSDLALQYSSGFPAEFFA